MTPTTHPSQRPLDQSTEICGRRVRVWRTEDARWHVTLVTVADGVTVTADGLPSLAAALDIVRAAIGGEPRV